MFFDALCDIGGRLDLLVFVEGSGKRYLIADFALRAIDPSIGVIGQDLALHILANVFAQRHILGIALRRIGYGAAFLQNLLTTLDKRRFNYDLRIAKGAVGEYVALADKLAGAVLGAVAPSFEIAIRLYDQCARRLADVNALVAYRLAPRLAALRGVDELHLAISLAGLGLRYHPHVGGNAGVVEAVVRQLYDRL